MPFTQTPPALFPTYLLSTLPFRQRRQSSVSSASSSSSSSSSSSTSPPPLSALPLSADPDPYLTGHASYLRCTRCLADLALSTQIISKGFTGRHGRAYLVAPPVDGSGGGGGGGSSNELPNLPNTFTHKPVPRQLVTGAHTVADIACALCGSVLGWKYVAAADEGQRYKVGKVILETKRVCRSSGWEEVGEHEHEKDEKMVNRHKSVGRRGVRGSLATVEEGKGAHHVATMTEEVEFDSQDEDECEDLFMGVWTPRLAMKRRKGRKFGRAVGEEDE